MPELPFGGVGESGFGRIHGADGLREFTRAKSITRQRFALPVPLTSFRRPASATEVLLTADQGAARALVAGLTRRSLGRMGEVPLYALGDREPDIDPTAYVHPDAVLIGSVTIGPESSVWPSAVLRGDHGDIRIGARTSIQDGTVIHCTPTVPDGHRRRLRHRASRASRGLHGRELLARRQRIRRAARGDRAHRRGRRAPAPSCPAGWRCRRARQALGVPAKIKPGAASARG